MPRDPVGPIQVLPPGLISWLQLKVGGFAPDELRQDIQPTIDLEDWWMRSTERTVTVAYTAQVVSPLTVATIVPFLDAGAVSLTVPQREWWHVRNATVRLRTDATVTATRVAVGMSEIGGPLAGVNVSVLGPVIDGILSAQYDFVTADDFWMPPGSTLGIWVADVATGVPGNVFDALLQGFKYSVLPL